MRGKVSDIGNGIKNIRITPAYAGKRAIYTKTKEHAMDHPRLCGEKRSEGSDEVTLTGITPAYAGKS